MEISHCQINFPRKYFLGDDYDAIQQRAVRILDKYLMDADLFQFNALERSVTFTHERLVPKPTRKKPRVMLLFSNPHPLSVQRGMFLSPNSRGQQNPFWINMTEAEWFRHSQNQFDPQELAKIFLETTYESPFELIFYCYFAFPTDYPDEIRKIFGARYFEELIEPEAYSEFLEMVQKDFVNAVVTFNKGIFNRVATQPVRRYIHRLIAGDLIQSQVRGMNNKIPIFLTFPTGWHYHPQQRQLKINNLRNIRVTLQESIKFQR